MTSLWIERQFPYDGSQLRSLFAYLNFGLLGDSIVSWRGPCDIPFDKMVDGEDLRAKAEIRGLDMVHFILEKFDCSLLGAVALQRLLSSVARDELRKLSPAAAELRREGDDLYLGDRKLSISIATVSPVSALVHFAVNVSNQGTPVPTLALRDLDVAPETFARSVLESWSQEMTSVIMATQKVNWVK